MKELSEILQPDDASRFLAGCTPEERRPIDPLTESELHPQPSPGSFTVGEREVAEQILKPGDAGYWEISEQTKLEIQAVERNSAEAALRASQTLFD